MSMTLIAAGPSTSQKPAARPPATSKPTTKPSPSKGPKGVRQLFDEAQQLYDAGKFAPAASAYEAILRKYQGHEPAQIQLAKSLYRLERWREALAVFARLNVNHLDAETSYEFAWSHYQGKKWEGALSGFQRLPKGHALFDLANYYGGISAIKLRRYDVAADMLEKAVVLPDKLAKSRALYIKHLQALVLMQQKANLAKERSKEQDRLKEQTSKLKKPEAGKAPDASKQEPPAYAGKQGVDRKASTSFAYQHQSIDRHGYATEDYEARTGKIEVASGYIFPLPIKQGKDRYGGLGLKLKLTGEDTIKEGTETRILVEEDAQEISRIQRQGACAADGSRTEADTACRSELQSGTVGGGVFFEVPLPEEVWIALVGSLEFTYPEFKRQGRSGNREGGLVLVADHGKNTYRAEGLYAQVLDAETEPTVNLATSKLEFSSAAVTDLSLSAKLKYQSYDYLLDNADGPDSASSFEAAAKQSMPMGFAAGITGTYTYLSHALFHGIPTYGVVAADGQVSSAKLALEAAPLPWFKFEVAQLIAKTRWTIDLPEAEQAFSIKVPDYIEEFNAGLTLNLVF